MSAIRKLLLLFVCAGILMTPALFNGFPLVFSDTGTYLASGIDWYVPMDRPIYYGLFLNFFNHLIPLWAPIFAQGLIISYLLSTLLKHLSKTSSQTHALHLIALIALLTVSSCVTWVVNLLMPDIFSAILYLDIIIAFLFFQEINSRNKVILFCILVLSMICHVSNILVSALLIITLFLISLFLRKKWWAPFTFYLFSFSALALSASLLIGSNALNEKPSYALVRSSDNFLLAKVISDGPGLLYLNARCPQAPLKTCLILPQLNQFKQDHPEAILSEYFLWSGIIDQAGGWEAVNAEAAYIVRKSVKMHPFMQAKALLKNSVEQLITFQAGEGLRSYSGDNIFTGHMVKTAFSNLYPQFLSSRQSTGSYLYYSSFNFLYTATVGVSFFGLLWFLFRNQLSPQYQILILSCLAFMLLNAITTGGLSAISNRYEARVIWLIPAIFYLLVLTSILDKSQTQKKI